GRACLRRAAGERPRTRRSPLGSRCVRSQDRRPPEAMRPGRLLRRGSSATGSLHLELPMNLWRCAPSHSPATSSRRRTRVPAGHPCPRSERDRYAGAWRASGDLLLLDEIAECVDGGERLDADLFILDLDAELLLEAENELERVNRVEAEPLSEERSVILNRGRIHIEFESSDNQALDLSR